MEEYKRKCAILDAEKKLREANNTPVVDTCATVAELTCANVGEVVPMNEVVIDFHVADDIADATVYEEVVDAEVSPEVEALVDIPVAHDTVIFDTPNAGPVVHIADLDIVEGGGKLKHAFVDPYLEHVDAYHDLHFYVASQDFIHIYLKPRDFSNVFLVKNDVTTYYVIEAKLFLHVNFDPGIFSRFIVESHGVTLFYDIMLIRGILFIREGMI